MLLPFQKCLNYISLKVCKICSLISLKVILCPVRGPSMVVQASPKPCLCSEVQTELVFPEGGRWLKSGRK